MLHSYAATIIIFSLRFFRFSLFSADFRCLPACRDVDMSVAILPYAIIADKMPPPLR